MLSLWFQPPPAATQWTNGHWVYWPMKLSATASRRIVGKKMLFPCLNVCKFCLLI